MEKSTSKYRIHYLSGKTWRYAPQGKTLEEAFDNYVNWKKRPKDAGSFCFAADVKIENGIDWSVLGTSDFQNFQILVWQLSECHLISKSLF